MKKHFKDTEEYIKHISSLDEKLFTYFQSIIKTDSNLTRQMVSFQANKKLSAYRWYKYKEAFSPSLVKHFLSEYHIPEGIILDPFAGSGTTLFASSEAGYDAEGIELLPVGQQIIKNRITACNLNNNDVDRIKFWRDSLPWKKFKPAEKINSIRITSGAYSEHTETSVSRFLSAIKKEKKNVSAILFFSLLCILESISYTRKDGQFLRWDYRSGRRKGQNTFDKGKIYTFDEAFTSKLDEIINDLSGKNIQLDLFSDPDPQNIAYRNIKLYSDSCLNILPKLQHKKYQAVITSPPYCNRYDYTRTYALEHALLRIQEQELSDLRQKMLSCTVENREKDLLNFNRDWTPAVRSCENNELLQSVITYLEHKKAAGAINNNGIPRMVRGYFYEMACVIQDCFRLLKNGGVIFMVNDNVRYAGSSISADLILSKIAEDAGFHIENVLVLPNGKGNSSQQMGDHGREILRKCVYIWRKPY
ncbi:DNA methyltransferase [Desulfonema magnum]|uniref:site-specific DNA-methyltransferase (cytosine-N(4)-specific) n=1 Tax=Desulfonema magnum TaxID=45655 RepID=A0A975BH89_9BACT|nr:DNA methyltransferase [Desulfonema magnum]QTA85253.1 SAM-dependent methyltransferase [Desulfonema magnum]